MEKALRNHRDYVQDLEYIGVDVRRFSLKHAISAPRKGELDSAEEGGGGSADRSGILAKWFALKKGGEARNE